MSTRLPSRHDAEAVAENPLLLLAKPLPEPELRPDNTALIVIDMQYLDAHPDHGVFTAAKQLGIEDHFQYYYDRLKQIIPRDAELIGAFRAHGIPVMYTAVAGFTRDGRDCNPTNRLLGLYSYVGDKDAQILEELAPQGDEYVIYKTCTSMFNSTTNVEQLFRNLAIKNLVIVGVLTNNCVYASAADASDRGYGVVVVEDACGAVTEELHKAAIRNLRAWYCTILRSDEVIERIGAKEPGLARSV